MSKCYTIMSDTCEVDVCPPHPTELAEQCTVQQISYIWYLCLHHKNMDLFA